MKNNKNNNSMPTEAEILHAAKVGMPMPKKNDAIEQGINNSQNSTQYAAKNHSDKNKKTNGNEKGKFDKDPSEMRKAPGYYDSVPGVNTPEIRIPENKKNDNVSVPAFNPPVPNRAWTAMKQGLDIEELSESEKRDLYVGRDRYF